MNKRRRIKEIISVHREKVDNEAERDAIDVIERFLNGRGNKVSTDTEVCKLSEWVSGVHTDWALLGLIKKGILMIDVDKQGSIVFSPTAMGLDVIDAVVKEDK